MIKLLCLTTQVHLFYDHLLRLDSESRYLRFQGTITDEGLKSYINSVQQNPNNFVAAKFIDNVVVGAVHMYCGDQLAELGFSVDDQYRGRGFARDLFNVAVPIAKENGCTTLYVDCFSSNIGMINLARSVGLSIVRNGKDASASKDVI
ncbi:MAG: GNAT family N-acetyltransferase [Richelia sp. RM2_1_2]|nr:GNAT family N-acetyltransferase [Richelia sp. RM2_1_2]